jgi:hypothetical protein
MMEREKEKPAGASAQARRSRRAVQHAMADDSRVEGQGQDRAITSRRLIEKPNDAAKAQAALRTLLR